MVPLGTHLGRHSLKQQLQHGFGNLPMLRSAARSAARQELHKPPLLGGCIRQVQVGDAVDQPLPCLLAVAARLLRRDKGGWMPLQQAEAVAAAAEVPGCASGGRMV